MKKYRVTEKHEILKEGLLIDKKTDSLLANSEIYFGVFCIKEWLRDGWIEETEKQEFTKDDMADSFHAGTIYNHRINAGFMPVVPFEKWIKKSKK